MTTVSPIPDTAALEARIAELEQSQCELTNTAMELTMKVMDKNNKIMQLTTKLRNRDLKLRRAEKKLKESQKQTKKAERGLKRDIKRREKAARALKEELENTTAEIAKLSSIDESTPTPPPTTDTDQPVATCIVACVRCYARERECDGREPCRCCSDRALVCERMKCNHFETGTCVRQQCGRLHQDQMEAMGYKHVIPWKRIPKPKKVYHPL